METVDLSDVQLVYQAQFFKGTATGGNVSAALGLAGEMAAYGSTTSFTNQLLLLGTRTYHVLMIRTWSERLEHLLKGNHYIAAMQLGAEFYSDPGKALVGLKGSKERKRSHISLRLVGILRKFLDVSMTKDFPAEGGMGTLTKYFNEIVPPCVELCVKLGKIDLLFDIVWTTFDADPFSRAVYLESLEPFILSDQLGDSVPPGLVQQFVTHYTSRGKLEGLEACVTHLSVQCLDLHQVMSVCQEHHLYDAIIHVYNNAMLDYITPTEKLLALLAGALDSKQPLAEQQVKLGNKLLVYVSCCLAGRAYPWGDVPRDRLKQVKYDVYSTITCLHSRAGGQEEEVAHPHLNTLLRFDTQGFLNVVSIAFEEEEFQSEVGQCQKQRLVDILLEVMLREEGPFSPAQVGLLFTFLAGQLGRGEEGSKLVVSRHLFSKVLVVLTQEQEGEQEARSSRQEREQALLAMVAAGGWGHFDLEVLMQSCERAGFYRLLQKLHEKEGRVESVFDCYIKDISRTSQVFSWLQRVLPDPSLSQETKVVLASQVETSLALLASLDARQTALVLCLYLAKRVQPALQTLEVKERYSLLGHILEWREQGSSPSTPVHGGEEQHYLASQHIYSDYLALMLEQEPGLVAPYLRTRPDCCPGQHLLHLARSQGVQEVQVLLLEREEKYEEAFCLLLEGLKQEVRELQGWEGEEVKWTSLNSSLVTTVTFCQRVSPLLASLESREGVWCPLLAVVTQPLASKPCPEVATRWREMVRRVVASMLGQVCSYSF